jgi:hypothetical protein
MLSLVRERRQALPFPTLAETHDAIFDYRGEGHWDDRFSIRQYPNGFYVLVLEADGQRYLTRGAA